MMSGVSVTRDTFRMMALVPEDLVGLPAEGEVGSEGEAQGEWPAWQGLARISVDGRNAVVLVSITVTAFHPRLNPGESLAASLRARDADGSALIEQFTTPGGNPAVRIRRTVTQQVNGRDVTTGQAQALVAYPGFGALGVVSGVALDPGDLDRAAVLVTGIAAEMTITSAPAAA
jgi:hypothetical protein